jgi:thiamine-phosphate pyrophosphorylase
MHKELPNIYHFIDRLDIKSISSFDKKIAFIYRNYIAEPNVKEIINFKNFCKKTNRIFIMSNNIDLVLKFELDGIYIPSFNKKINHKKNIYKKKIIVIGSAHSLMEIKIKEKQNVDQIFIAPIFKTNKSVYNLDIIKFNLLIKHTNKPIIALGGINKSNIKKLRMLNIVGLASISYLKENKKISRLVI